MFEQFYIEKKDNDGTTFEIRVRFKNKKFVLDDIGIKRKRKRNFTYVTHLVRDDWSYRRLNMNEQRNYMQNKLIESCPINLINEALTEAWEQSKPELFK